ncbi:MAG: TonB-dependent receptor [Algicola sp.]|nr:TonB-dependent receptor [Algicola sp.]
MKIIYSVLLCTLISAMGISQENKPVVQDSIKDKVVKLDEILITGNQKTDPIRSQISNNYEEHIVQPKNVADLFNGINGFSVIKRGNYAIDPTFRGSQYEQLNLQYDGGTKAMHACPNRMDPITTHVIPEEISKIEIIKGPYTVRYGATFGGIINLVSQKPNYSKNGWHGKVSAGYETNGQAFVNMFQLQYSQKSYDIVGNIGYRNFDNYEDGDGVEIPSAFKSSDYGLKIGYNLSDQQRLQLHWRQSFGRDVLHAGLPMDTAYDNSSILSLDYKFSELGPKIKNLSAKAYYSYVDHLMNNYDRPSFMMMEANSAVNSTTAGGKIELHWQPNANINVFTGVDAFLISRDGSRNRLIKIMNGNLLPTPMSFTDKVWQDAYINDYGVFTEAKWHLGSRALLTTGFRYDQINSDIKDPETDFAQLYNLKERTEHNFSGTISLKKSLSNQFIVELAYGRGVRSANMIERYINHFTVGSDPYEYIGNPNLKAEVNNQFEIGFSGNNRKRNFRYGASFYYSRFENYIVGVVDESLNRKFMPMAEPRHPKVFRNLNNSYKTGFELMSHIDFLKDYYVKAALAYVYSKNNDLKESLPLTPPFNSVFTVGMKRPHYWANIQYNVTSPQNHIAESFGETTTDGYDTLDLRVGILPLNHLSLGIAALNIFDESYNNHLNFNFTNQADFGRQPITEPGRNFSMFLQYKF